MMRPMPGPPDPMPHEDSARPHDSAAAPWNYCSGCAAENRLRLADPKRLTDAECAAEFWRATSETTTAALNHCPECPGCQAIVDEELTWHRFATRPHALEANP